MARGPKPSRSERPYPDFRALFLADAFLADVFFAAVFFAAALVEEVALVAAALADVDALVAAFRVAAAFDPACAVAYYGSGTAGLLDQLDSITCPLLFHFGDDDPYLPNSDVDAIKAATADRHHIAVHVHAGGGHAFDNHFAPHFSQPRIAVRAWTETLAFLFAHLGGPGVGGA